MKERLHRAPPLAPDRYRQRSGLKSRSDRILAEMQDAIWNAYREQHGEFASELDERFARLTVDASAEAIFLVGLGIDHDSIASRRETATQSAAEYCLSVAMAHLENAFQSLAHDPEHGERARGGLSRIAAVNDAEQRLRRAAHSRAMRILENGGRARRNRGDSSGNL